MSSRFVAGRVLCLAVSALCVSLMTGCGSGSGANSSTGSGSGSGGVTPPPAPPSPTIAITSPSNGATLTSLPVTLSVSLSGGVVPTQMTALLDGVDITADFAAGANGVSTATVNQPAVNYGENQLQIRYHSRRLIPASSSTRQVQEHRQRRPEVPLLPLQRWFPSKRGCSNRTRIRACRPTGECKWEATPIGPMPPSKMGRRAKGQHVPMGTRYCS